ncbi:MAG: Hsp70 family protein, partial [Deltaproteobacteria bacterium]|nr:Hsp70 family protein [Deltaproteobacteria bacterium]
MAGLGTSKGPLYVGFDLGTTNSAASVFDGHEVKVVRNSAGGALTPSVVRIDGKGRTTIGQRALRFADKDPANTHREFKRLMGTAQTLAFPDAGVSKSPQELGAMVLGALRKDIEDVIGVLPERAVISVPALFELPQSSATSEAAKLAGFEQVELLQEPIASALAAGWSDNDPGAWLVYDLGGGTFDVSLLETRDGLLRVVAHDGDNFLGGRDFDRALMAWALDQIDARGQTIDRSKDAGELGRLRLAAEQAKIELSRANEVELLLDEPLVLGGQEYEVDLQLDRNILDQVCMPLVDRTLTVCERLLRSQGMRPDQLSRVVLVGGPSVMPMVRHKVAESLATDIAEGFDPMTLVAQGASLYAATAGLDGRPAASKPKSDPDAAKLWCQFPPVTADINPHVVGKVEGGAVAIASIQLDRVDSSGTATWHSPVAEVDAEGAFVLDTELVPHKVNRFLIAAKDEAGKAVATDPAEITVVHGVTIGDPPLSRSIGVA